MRVAVLGAGTAGHMAVAQLDRYVPDADVAHFYDPRTAPIGVGEGTTPVFTEWAARVMGWDFADLERLCDATEKAGIVFEGWRADGEEFTHFFGSREGAACHLSAARLAEQLAARSTAEEIAEPVRSLTVRESEAQIEFGSCRRRFDFVIDARGFPDPLGDDHVRLRCVPTDAACLTRGPPRSPRDRTRAIARPHGWIFVIPLGTETAYGYIHGRREQADARADFSHFLVEEDVVPHQPLRSLGFPNFRCATLFDGVVMKIGNRAGFVEPLEATALGMIVLQLQFATYWLLERSLGLDDGSVDAIDRALAEPIDEVATFIGWHYGAPTGLDAPFWTGSAERFDTWRRGRPADHADRFDSFVRRGLDLPRPLAFARSVTDVDRLTEPCDTRADTFGGFLDVSFAKVGHGIGWS